MTRLLGSLTAAPAGALADAAARLLSAGVDGLHVDLADGHFVPYLAFPPALVADLRGRFPESILDVHLMVEEPEAYWEELARAGASRVVFHVEARRYPWRAVTLAHRAGLSEVGVALNPVTPFEALESVRGRIAVVDLLTTEPDVAGEQLLPGSVARVQRLRELLSEELIQVDGGVTEESAAALTRAGANELVVGRAITAAGDWHAAVQRLREALRS